MTFEQISPIKTIKKNLLLCFILISCLSGCASPGPKYVDLAYEKHHSPTRTGTMGIAQFKDNRKKIGKGVVGYRILTDKTQETYMVRGKNLSATLTELTRVYLEKTGFVVTPIPHWPRTLDAMADAPDGLDHILSADINTLLCRAQKNGVYTDMTLEISITFYLGNIQNKKLSTIPVSLVLERTDLVFDQDKLEQFINQAFEDIIKKTFPFQ